MQRMSLVLLTQIMLHTVINLQNIIASKSKFAAHWVPLSTRRASVPMPSMLMNSVAKVGSADSLASSFRASRRASMPWDWILSRSWRAARACQPQKNITSFIGLSHTPTHWIITFIQAMPQVVLNKTYLKYSLKVCCYICTFCWFHTYEH